MRGALRRIVGGERGISLAELLMGASIAVATLALVVTWISTTSGVDMNQEADFDALNELRFAKSQIERELRFADGLLTAASSNSVEVWIDLDGNGAGPDSAGERVTWSIVSSQLQRYVDGASASAQILLDDVDEAASELSVAGSTVTITLTVGVDQGRTTSTRTLKTRVNVRNA
jgi:hypothetical protein